ncbi:MAG: GntR family transcriptional regulator [Deltaproteobacteria bacterium]|nr:GntR family transcriptional regulator [Deltaproteobacteria bacterium]
MKADVMKLKKLDKIEPIKEKVYTILLENIVEGRMRPGEQLVEQAVAAGLGVSKSPVRDALHRLSGDGLVVGAPYKGFSVAPMSVQEFRELMQVRLAIELFCIEQAMDDYSEADISEFKAHMDRAGSFLEDSKDSLAQETHLDFHSLIVKRCGNELMQSIYETIRKKLRRYLRSNIRQTPERIRISNQYHLKILERIKKKDKQGVIGDLKEHFNDIIEAYLSGKMETKAQIAV